MAPSTSASLTIPLAFAIAGNATWLVGFCVSRFARPSASPGSLYTYPAETLPPVLGVAAAWGLLLAYLATGASVAGVALYYTGVLSQKFLHWTRPVIVSPIAVCLVGDLIAYRDVKLCAQLMLWIEVCCIGLICIALAVMAIRFGFRIDMDQFGFLTAYALVAAALPFVLRVRRQHSQIVDIASIAAGLVVVLIAFFDLRATSDIPHARLPIFF